jgi:hypothetical protein
MAEAEPDSETSFVFLNMNKGKCPKICTSLTYNVVYCITFAYAPV